jgi:predicted DNA-binding transcriptional regulator AlpA
MKSTDTGPAAQRDALYTQRYITVRGAFSKSHLYNLIARGHFPVAALKVGPRFTRWSAGEVNTWFEDPAAWIASYRPAEEFKAAA